MMRFVCGVLRCSLAVKAATPCALSVVVSRVVCCMLAAHIMKREWTSLEVSYKYQLPASAASTNTNACLTSCYRACSAWSGPVHLYGAVVVAHVSGQGALPGAVLAAASSCSLLKSPAGVSANCREVEPSIPLLACVPASFHAPSLLHSCSRGCVLSLNMVTGSLWLSECQPLYYPPTQSGGSRILKIQPC